MPDGLTDSCIQAHGDTAGVAVVVVTYNRKQLLSRCLDALLAQTHPLHAIFVIDNASTDGTGELIARRYRGRIEYHRLPHNAGGAGGFHAGMRRAVAAGVEWVWVMDDDVWAEPGALRALIRAASGDFVVPVPVRVSDVDGALEEAACVEYDMRSAWRAPGRHMTSVKSVFADAGDLPPLLTLANCSFEGPLIPASSIERVGLPLSEFFIYGDDTEFALRLRKSGMRLMLVREARVRRMLAGACAASAAWKTRYIIRNSFWINRLHGRNLTTRHLRNHLWAAALLAVNVLRLRFLFDPERFAAAMRGILQGLWARLPEVEFCAAAPEPLASPGPPEPAAAPIFRTEGICPDMEAH